MQSITSLCAGSSVPVESGARANRVTCGLAPTNRRAGNAVGRKKAITREHGGLLHVGEGVKRATAEANRL
jgi:hypothetical protein